MGFNRTNSINNIRLPWFRVHIVILNDPGRLISVHIMHTGMLASWSGLIVLYELITFDPTDPAYNPCWRQGSYVIPFISRIGLISSLYSWSLGIKLNSYVWTYETITSAWVFRYLINITCIWPFHISSILALGILGFKCICTQKYSAIGIGP